MTDNVVFESVADLQKLIRGSSNSQSMALLNSVMVETIGMSMYNAVSTQHNAQMLNTAATTSTCAKILSVIGAKPDPAPAGGDISGLIHGGLPSGHDKTQPIEGAIEAAVSDIKDHIEDKKDAPTGGDAKTPPVDGDQNNPPAGGQ